MAEHLNAASGATWLRAPRAVRRPHHERLHHVAQHHHAHRTGDQEASAKDLHAVPAGKIVAESTFGCWVNLLDKDGTRGDGPYRKIVDTLADACSEVLRPVEYIDPDAASWLGQTSRVSDLLRARPWPSGDGARAGR
ncbi:hypothetical protein [Streptomyces aureus]|uniref:hypothetical protein n=1 Tax=Streptomyces aureus TaxID=193461 RepID=UPI0033C40B42